MVKILRKKGWILNPNDKIVNAILNRVEKNEGNCPCHNDTEDKQCPCSNYREHDHCCCGLYVKLEDWQ
jgi:ferredoxin-thioredoxin reductase catalytic subunit